ncbi:MAG: hypothetical protein IPO67_04735 [Deltaproteobacteria bacterium]|nr:hypothetical protein [Deltaproteobacteria bacterium]MBK9366468.1 hypothetical protein [Deltaproteobacteria bacterium]MBK9644447.1 hypothetical protein [Deltaproteobacteria bacterium]
MSSRAALLAFALTWGCYSPDDHDAAYDLAFCDKVFECEEDDNLPFLPYTTVEECVVFREDARAESGGTSSDETCAFDASVGKACVEDLTALPCPSYDEGRFPTACAQVCGPNEASEG